MSKKPKMYTFRFTPEIASLEVIGDDFDPNTILISAPLKKYLMAEHLRLFRVINKRVMRFTTASGPTLQLNWIKNIRITYGDVACHYIDADWAWGGSVTICREKLIKFFGSIPKFLTIYPIKETSHVNDSDTGE